MIGYTTLGTNDFERATAFYDELLEGMGAKRLQTSERYAYWGKRPGPGMLAIFKPYDGESATAGNGTMVALGLRSQAQVAEMHARALRLGASDDGAPGSRADNFFGAYVRDLDGNKLCFFTFE